MGSRAEGRRLKKKRHTCAARRLTMSSFSVFTPRQDDGEPRPCHSIRRSLHTNIRREKRGVLNLLILCRQFVAHNTFFWIFFSGFIVYLKTYLDPDHFIKPQSGLIRKSEKFMATLGKKKKNTRHGSFVCIVHFIHKVAQCASKYIYKHVS